LKAAKHCHQQCYLAKEVVVDKWSWHPAGDTRVGIQTLEPPAMFDHGLPQISQKITSSQNSKRHHE